MDRSGWNIIEGDKEALEYAALRAVFFETDGEFESLLAQLEPRGRLRLVEEEGSEPTA